VVISVTLKQISGTLGSKSALLVGEMDTSVIESGVVIAETSTQSYAENVNAGLPSGMTQRITTAFVLRAKKTATITRSVDSAINNMETPAIPLIVACGNQDSTAADMGANMIQWKAGNIFDSNAEFIVIPVNCVGIMGAGLAKQVATLHPFVRERYIEVCSHGHIIPGQVGPSFGSTGKDGTFRHFLMAATKDHWRDPSKLEWVVAIIEMLAMVGKRASIAVPALGCGRGGLDWAVVKPIIIKHLEPVSGTIEVYEPNANL
jgi:O-acetyl-ADP-ribose deacetylase (regulator of RNase III)